MAKKPIELPEQKLVAAALALATDGQWATASLGDVATKADLKLSDMFGIARSKGKVLDLVEQSLTRETVDEVGELDPKGSVRDNLFDLLMTRFETMNANRAAYLDLSRHARAGSLSACQPEAGVGFLASLAGVETDGIQGQGRLYLLQQLYLKALAVWRKDETDDLSATMKELDTELTKAEDWANRVASFDLNSFFKTGFKPATNKQEQS